jgi:hypothetical protein
MPRKKPEQEVGYGRPPKATQFRTGVSGNPGGRPKGSLNIGIVLERIARQTITINQNGRRRTITKLEAAAMQIANKAASGDLKASTLQFNLLRTFLASATEGNQKPPLDADDRAVIAGMLKQMHSPKGNKK